MHLLSVRLYELGDIKVIYLFFLYGGTYTYVDMIKLFGLGLYQITYYIVLASGGNNV